MTGYQEILTDLSYAVLVIRFTSPHKGNVGANPEDLETKVPMARGFGSRESISEPANWRAAERPNDGIRSSWPKVVIKLHTRRLPRRTRHSDAPVSALVYNPLGEFNIQ